MGFIMTFIHRLLVLFFVLYAFQTSAIGLKAGKALFIKGDVHRVLRDKKYPIKKGDLLDHADVVATGNNSLAVLAIGQDYRSKIKVMQNSKVRVEINEKVPSTEVTIGGIVALVEKELDDGTKKAITSKLRIKTNSVSLGVRGTQFMVYVGDNNNTISAVNEGEVELFNKGDENKKLPMLLRKNFGAATNEIGRLGCKKNFSSVNKVINWNVSDDENVNMFQSKAFFTRMEKLWKEYKDEQECLFKEMKKEQQKNWDMYKGTMGL